MVCVMECMLKDKCQNCKDSSEPLKCKIFIQWFKFQQNASLKSHSRELVKNPFVRVLSVRPQ